MIQTTNGGGTLRVTSMIIMKNYRKSYSNDDHKSGNSNNQINLLIYGTMVEMIIRIEKKVAA